VLAKLPGLPGLPGLPVLPKVPSVAKVPTTVGGGDDAAFGVFLRLEVLDFDFLSFFLCHFIFLSGWFVSCQ
jgi:hypothetical protein